MRGKLYRSSTNQILSGVCGGIGEYFDIDPTIIRLIWILISLPSPITSIIVYITCTIIIPENLYTGDNDFSGRNVGNRAILFGSILIIIGASLLLKNIFPWFNFNWYYIKKFWPAIFVLLGVYIIIKERQNY